MKHPDALILIDEIRKQGYRPNDWEVSFMQSIELSNEELTAKQAKCLNAIYEKSVGGGVYQKRERI